MKQAGKSLIPWFEEIDLRGREVYREYIFPGKEKVRLIEPVTLIVSDNGHRVVTADGLSHYVPYGWIHLYWECPEGREHNFYCQEQLQNEAKQASNQDEKREEE